MLETSKDLFFVVLSFCVLWLTVFLCWMLYYVAMLLKQGYELTRGLQTVIGKVNSVIDAAKGKFEKSTSHLGLLADSVGQLVKFFIARSAATGTEPVKTKRKK
ncbi:MAG: hypothetical protein AAB817_00785 [Patescibacteria group bacterium]